MTKISSIFHAFHLIRPLKNTSKCIYYMTRVYVINVYSFGIKAMHTYCAERDLNDHTCWWFYQPSFCQARVSHGTTHENACIQPWSMRQVGLIFTAKNNSWGTDGSRWNNGGLLYSASCHIQDSGCLGQTFSLQTGEHCSFQHILPHSLVM